MSAAVCFSPDGTDAALVFGMRSGSYNDEAIAEFLLELNRPGFPGDSKPWKGWSHGEEGNLEAVSA